MASQSIFRGTLFDAKLIKNIMLVKDCYHIMGNNIVDMEMNEKMIYLDTILANQFQTDGCANFKLKINKLYRYDMLKEIIENIIPKCELEITGLIFYPKKSGISYIYTDKKQSDKIDIQNNQSNQNNQIINNTSYNMIHQIKEFLCSRVYSYENNDVKFCIKNSMVRTPILCITNLFFSFPNSRLDCIVVSSLFSFNAKSSHSISFPIMFCLLTYSRSWILSINEANVDGRPIPFSSNN